MATSTSFRISDAAKAQLAVAAAREGVSATALVERLIVEGARSTEHPGIVFRGPGTDRRAALAAGPDVWEVVARLQELEGTEEHRVHLLAEETDVHSRLIRLALDYAAEYPEEIQERVDRQRARAERSRAAVQARAELLA